ncbi:MAG: hypothetical protein ABDH37_06725 [Candidatus Hydrothermales bacterium]
MSNLGEGCGYTIPPSIRFLKNLVVFSKSKNLYLSYKGIKKEYVDYIDILESFSFMSPFNGIINEFFTETKYMGDTYFAAIDIERMIRKKIESKEELNKINEDWSFIKEIVSEINEIAKNEGNLLKIKSKDKIEKILSKYKNPLISYYLKNDRENF